MRRIAATALVVSLAAACSGSGSDSDAGAASSPAPVDPAVTDPPHATDGADGVADATTVATTLVGAAKPEPARTTDGVDAPAGVRPVGFETVSVRITATDGSACEVCLWSAESPEQRGRGLMGVTDLGEPVGMLFRFDEATTGNFFMFRTPMPLSIAWFDADGAFVAETDMEPCLSDASSECARYGPGAEYRYAIEMVRGELDVIGIGPGSRFEVLAEHDVCP